MTKQETFNIVVPHLLSMDDRAMDNGGCAYRGTNGRKCAVGILIPDEMYTPAMEGHDSRSMMVSGMLRALGHDVELCKDLQLTHDLYFETRSEQLRAIAKRHELELPPALAADALVERAVALARVHYGANAGRLVPCEVSAFHGHHPWNEECRLCEDDYSPPVTYIGVKSAGQRLFEDTVAKGAMPWAQPWNNLAPLTRDIWENAALEQINAVRSSGLAPPGWMVPGVDLAAALA